MFEQSDSKHPHFDSACSRFAASHSLAEVARAAGINVQMLRNKLNPEQSHQLTARDLVALFHATGDETLLDGLLFECGLTAIAIPEREKAPSLAHQVIDTTAKVAGLGAQALTVVESGRVTKGQRNALVGAATAAMGNLAILITEIEHKYQAIPSLSCALDIARMAAGA
ncbi:phage regulatory CII family protein [Aeromonas media]|uniref:Phage regulatory CII family protein n=1 Tax=Aeromonas media TaxID=651 RepID=A0AAP6L0Y5_AERME|nr:phage regulatory CII family protein [Aeromonas media]MDX7921654.1 phage regulatory CII family protein [Aeromonas media]